MYLQLQLDMDYQRLQTYAISRFGKLQLLIVWVELRHTEIITKILIAIIDETKEK